MRNRLVTVSPSGLLPAGIPPRVLKNKGLEILEIGVWCSITATNM